MVRAISLLVLLSIGGAPPLWAQDAAQTITVYARSSQMQGSGVSIRVPVDPLAGADLAEILARLPGVQVRRSGGLGSFSEASLRGSNGRQVQLLLDGLPLDLGGGDASSLSLISPLMLQQAEVFKGRVPARLGAGLAGSINLKTPDELPAPLLGRAGIGSFGQRQIAAAGQLHDDWQISAGSQSADNNFRYRNRFRAFDPSDPDRRRQAPRRNAATAQRFADVRWRGPWVMRANVLDDRQELPTRANFAQNQAAFDTRSFGLSASAQAQATWQWRIAHRHSVERLRDPASEIGLGAQNSRDTTDRSLLQLGRTFDQLSLFWTAEQIEYDSSDRRSELPDFVARRSRLSQALDWQADQTRLGVRPNASLSLQWSDEQADREQQDQWLVQPAIGVSRRQGDCVYGANLGQRERLPSFFERYGDRGLFRGNPDLQPETARYADASARCATPGVLQSLEISVFGQDLRDAISPAFNAQGVGRSVNTSRAQIYGLELTAAAFWGGMQWDLSATRQHTEDRSRVRATRGKQLPGRFENQINAAVARDMLGLRVSYRFGYEHGQFYDSPNLLRAEPLRRHDLGLRGALLDVGWSLQILNIGDDKAEQFNGFPTPGRHWRFSVAYPRASLKE